MRYLAVSLSLPTDHMPCYPLNLAQFFFLGGALKFNRITWIICDSFIRLWNVHVGVKSPKENTSIFAGKKGLLLVSLAAQSQMVQTEQGIDLPNGLCSTCSSPYPISSLKAACSPCSKVQEMACCWAASVSPLHSDVSHIENVKTLPVLCCSVRAFCFPLDTQVIRAVFPYDRQRSKSAQGFLWLRKKKLLYHTLSEHCF